MQQGNVIFGVLLLAYIVYIVQRGELSTYLTLLRGGGQVEINQAQTSTGLGMIGNSLSSGLFNTNIGSLFSGAPATGGSFGGSSAMSGNTALDVFGPNDPIGSVFGPGE